MVTRASFEGSLPPFSALLVSADGRYVVAGTEAAPPGGGGGGGSGGGMPAGVAVLNVPDLRVTHLWELSGNAGVAAVALTGDNTNLLVSGTDRTLTIIADPRLSMRLVDQMFHLGWDTMV